MAKRELTEAAKVAKLIRKEIKEAGIEGAKVRSSNFAGGNSVRITLPNDLHPSVVETVKDLTLKYKAGSFNAMEEIYEYNSDRQGPTAKYITVNAHYSDELRQKVWEWIVDRYEIHHEGPVPKDFKEAQASDVTVLGGWVNVGISRELGNTGEGSFWDYMQRLNSIKGTVSLAQPF